MQEDTTSPESEAESLRQAVLPGTEGTHGSEAEGTPAAPAAGLGIGDLGTRFDAFVHSLERPIVVFDTETTGTDPQSDRIIEISFVRVSPAPIGVEPPRTWRVNPGSRIPVEATRVHGISNEDVAQCPTFAELAPELLQFLEGCDLAGFNVCRFDARILQIEFMRAGFEFDLTSRRIIDTQVIYHQREPRTLAAALQHYRGKALVNAHGAEADAVATLEVLAGQLARYADLESDVQTLHDLSNAGNDAYCDTARRFSWRDDEPMFNFGKLKGKSLRWAAADPNERSYLRWVLESNFEDETKLIVKEALEGRIRRRTGPDPA